MKSLVLFFFTLTVCSGLETNDSLKLDINVNETNFIDLSSKIVEIILKPSGKPQDLLENVQLYFNALEKVHNDMKLEYQYTFDIYDEIKKRGGPLHCQDHLNGTDMIVFHNLKTPFVLKIYRAIEATNLTWDKVDELAKELREKYRKMNEVTTPDGLGISQIEWQRREAKMDLREKRRKKEQEEKEKRQARREERVRIREEIEFARQHSKLRREQLRQKKEQERLARHHRGGKKDR